MTLRAVVALSIATLGGCLMVMGGMSGASSFLVVGPDLEVSDNTSRSVVDFDDCASMETGATIAIDIAIGHPGIPESRGLAAYQFRLFYDPEVLRVVADDHNQLLDQAAGSNIIPLADPKPDADGVYLSSGVDFGASGIEPEGTSEIGPGILGRVTLAAVSTGSSGLVLQDVILKDDEGDDITVDSVQSAQIYVGQPCPGFEPSPTPASPVVRPSATPSPGPASGAGDDAGNGEDAGDSDNDAGGSGNVPGVSDPVEMVITGGPPGSQGYSGSVLMLMIGAILAMAGAVTTFLTLRSGRVNYMNSSAGDHERTVE